MNVPRSTFYYLLSIFLLFTFYLLGFFFEKNLFVTYVFTFFLLLICFEKRSLTFFAFLLFCLLTFYKLLVFPFLRKCFIL